MVIKGLVKKNEYYDSVALMLASERLRKVDGIIDAICIMGTAENRSILMNSGLYVDEFANSKDSDLLIAVSSLNAGIADGVLSNVSDFLKSTVKIESGGKKVCKSLDGALEIMKDANLVLISTPGKYARDESYNALKRGMNVMIFSDNVSIEDELFLKKYAKDHGLFVMGPDCGTAIINGVPLCFANEVERGNIGVVAAAGTGLQEVSTIISNNGGGISHGIGTGGLDVKKEIGGIMFIESINALMDDIKTEVILLISKKPNESVLANIEDAIVGKVKPVVTLFLGDRRIQRQNIYPVQNLEEAALTALYLLKGRDLSELSDYFKEEDNKVKKLATSLLKEKIKEQRYIRGLFSGGTLCQEAQLIIGESLDELYSNTPIGKSIKLKDPLKSVKNTIVDLGDDEFTRGKPHPMIDYTIRKNRLKEEAEDPETLIILLDVVLGYGSCLHPEEELAPVIRDVKNKNIIVICGITGTKKDPQDRAHVESVLSESGAIVMKTNRAACKLAAALIKNL